VRLQSGFARNALNGHHAKQQSANLLKRQPFRNEQKRFAMSGDLSVASMKESMKKDPVPWWLFGCAGMIATTLTVGAAASLTRSGASMLYWKPHGAFPPKSESDWHKEFQAYQEFCHFHQRKEMSLEDFKRNFKWEYAHRLLGEATALAFVGPLGYFFLKEKLPRSIHGKLAAILGLGAAQMYFGRAMVRSNVEEHHQSEQTGHFATFGLPAHAAFSLANMSLLLWTGFHLVSPASRAITLRELTTTQALKNIGEVRKYLQAVTGLFLGTVIAGTAVAEIDAGRAYNTSPKMGKHWIPEGLFEQSPWYRNFYDNMALVLLDHRLLAVGTLAAYAVVFMKARKPNVWSNLPGEAKTALNLTMAAIGGQVAFGATMLVYHVPTSMAMAHTSGAALILSSSLWSLYTLRFARSSTMGAAVKAATKLM
jgi:cytochrome c oxidase assembly protein subunit 15